MYCKKCGAAVVGKFCSCCGFRVRSQLEEFRLEERRRAREFKNTCANISYQKMRFDLMHLADACWLASSARYGLCTKGLLVWDTVPAEAYESLKNIESHAMALFLQLLNF